MNNNPPAVQIALATYNGERFLPELIQSLEAQSYSSVQICTSDDGSTDNTREILNRTAALEPVLVAPFHPRGNILRNFENAIDITSAPYVALCDQDDVWLPGKIEILVNKALELENQYGSDIPIIVFCDLEIVDENLQTISSSFFRSTLKSSNARNFNDFVLNNHVPGCAILVNRALLNLAIPIPQLRIHDHWLMQIATLCGYIAYVDHPLVKYRQHDSNNIGLGSAGRKDSSPWSVIRALPKKLIERETRWRSQAAAIYENLEALHERVGHRVRRKADAELIATVLEPMGVWRLSRFFRHAVTGERLLDRWALIWLLSGKGTRSRFRRR